MTHSKFFLSLFALFAYSSNQTCCMQKLKKALIGHLKCKQEKLALFKFKKYSFTFTRCFGTNYHKILDVPQGASKEEIKKAYKRKALALHPDSGGNHDQFLELKNAYETLVDSNEYLSIKKENDDSCPSEDLQKKDTCSRSLDLDNINDWPWIHPGYRPPQSCTDTWTWKFYNNTRHWYSEYPPSQLSAIAQYFLDKFHFTKKASYLSSLQQEQLSKYYYKEYYENQYNLLNIKQTASLSDIRKAIKKFKTTIAYCPHAPAFYKDPHNEKYAFKVVDYYCGSCPSLSEKSFAYEHEKVPYLYRHALDACNNAEETLMDPRLRKNHDIEIAFSTFFDELPKIDPHFTLAQDYIAWYWKNYYYKSFKEKKKKSEFIQKQFKNVIAVYKQKKKEGSLSSLRAVLSNELLFFTPSGLQHTSNGYPLHTYHEFDTYLYTKEQASDKTRYNIPNIFFPRIVSSKSSSYANYVVAAIEYMATHDKERNELIKKIDQELF